VKAGEILRRVWAPGVLVVAYLVLRAVFDGLSERGGLVSPTGSVSLGVAIIGGIVLVLRIVVLFVLPAVIVYRAIALLLERLRPR
jgi:hypothetical protein